MTEATDRDLAEADAHERRRLVAALARADGTARPPRGARAVVGGVVLALLLVAGAWVVGLVRPRPAHDWRDGGLVVARETGARYVLLGTDQRLRPVRNLASAHLLLGGRATPVTVPLEEIRAHDVGEPVGVPLVDEPPAADDLIAPVWRACAGSGESAVDDPGEIGPTRSESERAVRETRSGGAGAGPDGLVVEAPDGRLHLVARGRDGELRRFPFDDLDLVHRTILQGARVMPVPDDWLRLVPEGPALAAESFRVRGAGTRPAYADALDGAGDVRVGDVVRLAGRRYLLGPDAPLLLTGFAATVHRWVTGTVPSALERLAVTARPAPGLDRWPERFPAPLDPGRACVVLDGADQRLQLASAGGQEDHRGPPVGGSLVRAGDAVWAVVGGVRLPLADGAASALGYAGVRPTPVPRAWLALLPCGPGLSRDAALAGMGKSTCDAVPGARRTKP